MKDIVNDEVIRDDDQLDYHLNRVQTKDSCNTSNTSRRSTKSCRSIRKVDKNQPMTLMNNSLPFIQIYQY